MSFFLAKLAFWGYLHLLVAFRILFCDWETKSLMFVQIVDMTQPEKTMSLLSIRNPFEEQQSSMHAYLYA